MAPFQKIIAFYMSIVALLSGMHSYSKATEQPTPQPVVSSRYAYYDYPYGENVRQTLDLVLPENETGTKGLILFLHGGGWSKGDKDRFRKNLKKVSSRGFAGGAINYRYLSDKVHMDALMADVAAALAKMKELAARQGIRLKKVLLTGSSAGGHMSLLYAYRYRSVSPIRPVAVVSFSGPSNLCDPKFIEHNALGNTKAMIGLLNRLCGVVISEADYRNRTGQYAKWIKALKAYSPLYHVTAQTVPTVMGHGKQDTIVPFSNVKALNRALKSNGVTHRLVVYQNSGHGLDQDPDASAQMNKLFLQYAKTYLN